MTGDIYDGEFRDDQMHGYGMFISNGIIKFEGEFNQGTLHG